MNIGVTHRKKGVALVVVLSCLLLVCGLVLSFFLSISTETKGSRLADSSNRVRDLVDTTSNIVIAQLRAATTVGTNVAWASQPGMIRTYGTANGELSQSPKAYYKLYSAENMIWEPGSGTFNPSADVPTDWYSKPSLYTDLNIPVANMAGTLQYPIVDPRATAVGFDVSGVAPSTDNQVPMPVRWVYVLRDGTLSSPLPDASAPVPQWTAGADNAPTANNPIVGRIAFWTDDETSKVNINTAAGDVWPESATPGSYWDVPRTYGAIDREMARYQLANGEYQRYPGHPATTYLSAVFPDLTREQIGSIVPRVKNEGSKGGTALPAFPVTADGDRLYASIDELVFNPQRAANTGITQDTLETHRFFLTASSRAPETTLFNTPRISIWPLNRDTDVSARTTFDRLIGFCSTIGNHEYFFKRDTASRSGSLKREHAASPWLDYFGSPTGSGATDVQVDASRNRELFDYLRALTTRGVPGYSPNTAFNYGAKYSEDRDQILTEIFDYVRMVNLFDDSLTPPDNRYNANGKQFTNYRTSATGTAAGHGQVAPIRIPSEAAPSDRSKDNMGFGRFHTLSEVAIQFICTADGSVDPDKANPSTGEQLMIKSNKPENRTLKNIVGTDGRGVPLEKTQRQVEALILLELFTPAQGWTGLQGDLNIRIKGLNQFSLNTSAGTKALEFPEDASMRQTGGNVYNGRAWGGTNGFRFTLNGRRFPKRGNIAADSGLSDNNVYPFVSVPVTVDTASNTMQFTGGQLEIEIYSDADRANDNTLVRTIVIDVPDGTFPIPSLALSGTDSNYGAGSDGTPYYHAPGTDPEDWWTFSRKGVFFESKGSTEPATNPGPYEGTAGRSFYVSRAEGSNGGLRAGGFVRREDVVRSLMPYHGDYRLVAASSYVYKDLAGNNIYLPHRDWNDTGRKLAHTLQVEASSNNIQKDVGNTSSDSGTNWRNQPAGKLVALAPYPAHRFPDGPQVFPQNAQGYPELAGSYAGTNLPETFGDWDTGLPTVVDGAYINKPDDGNDYRNGGNGIPYFDVNWAQQSGGETLFSPNRQIPSAVMFGSLSTGVKAGKPWQTLLFRPDVTGTATMPTHPGAQANYPKDHLLLDLFWMPVVEPYAISEPFSTAGKINMNYQMVPFTNIKRSTALHALLRSERVTAIPFSQGNNYKSSTNMQETRRHINREATLLQFQEKFDDGEIFRSASEICELHLVPESLNPTSADAIFAQMKSFWQDHRLTGDNVKERPYATLYPRLTTKSNTYTVHYKVQAIRQASRSRGTSDAAWATWDESKDQVLSEYRGSTTIERYVDPLDPELPDFALLPETSTETLDDYYRFRVLQTKKFAP